jgi:hypothetical protein
VYALFAVHAGDCDGHVLVIVVFTGSCDMPLRVIAVSVFAAAACRDGSVHVDSSEAPAAVVNTVIGEPDAPAKVLAEHNAVARSRRGGGGASVERDAAANLGFGAQWNGKGT